MLTLIMPLASRRSGNIRKWRFLQPFVLSVINDS